ncbi:MAG TPA: hypothetical protein G4N99_09640 [Thermoflexia bacterium]|nr:hypothetical protein [Thermoflexia bacterium]
MNHRFVRVVSMLVILVSLLAVAGGAAWGYEVEREANKAPHSTTGGAERVDDASLICLALVSGTALLAGGVWMGQMRRMLS